MAKAYKFFVGIVTALALCKYSLAEWNTTDEIANRTVSHCHHQGNRHNCTEDTTDTDTDEWGGHFSKCSEELTNYCVHGECRYIKDQKTPSCRCQYGYEGDRCQYLVLGPRKEHRQRIIIACVVVLLVLLILLIIFICFCSHRRYRLCWRSRRRREEPRNGTEKLAMMDTSTAHAPLTSDSTEAQQTNLVWGLCVSKSVAVWVWRLFGREGFRPPCDSCCLLSHSDGSVL